MSLLKWIGVTPNGNKQPPPEGIFDGEDRYFGLENFGNTCYCNSVLQALYFCKPFRECVNNFPIRSPLIARTEAFYSELSNNETSTTSEVSMPKPKRKPSSNLLLNSKTTTASQILPSKLPFNPDDFTTHQALNTTENLFTSLKDLFARIECQTKRLGTIAPSSFIQRLKEENELFRGAQHQDAHEFLNFTLNAIAEHVVKMKKLEPAEIDSKPNSEDDNSQTSSSPQPEHDVPRSWVQQIFEGKLTNETKCLTCDTVTCKEESFLDLSIDIEENSSVSSCLRQFSANEMLCDRNKYFCDVCNNLQEAEKRMRIKKVPNVLALHLKRFKYQERLQRYAKLSYRVVFPMDLRLFNTTSDSEDTDRLYSLFAIVVHIGSGLNHGHYISVVKSGSQWLLFDDETVERIDEEDISKFFGDVPGVGSGYVLFYEACDLNLESLGLSVDNPGCSPSSAELALPTSPLSLDSIANLAQPTGTRNVPKKKTLNPPSFVLNPVNPYSSFSPPSTASITSNSTAPSSNGSSGGWFSKGSKPGRSKPTEIKIPKHEFFTNPSDRERENSLNKSSSAVMTGWR